MAVISGYVLLPHSTYSAWKTATLGNSYDADLSYGCQCWDYAAEFWYNITGHTGYPLTGPNQSASECWTNVISRLVNAGVEFDLIYNFSQIKTGDVIVMAGQPGHICFANEDYQGTNTLSTLGQNYNNQSYVSEDTITFPSSGPDSFLGAFRLKAWHPSPPPITRTASKFKWILYANKIRKRNQLI